jgi:hypothetical protein
VYSAERKVAMNRTLASLVAGLLLLALGGTARADLTYTYTTTVPGDVGGGIVSGSFTVPSAAILKGSLVTSDLKTWDFTYTGATFPPFVPFEWTPSNSSPFASVNVDPHTGLFASPFTGSISFTTPNQIIENNILFAPTNPNTAAALVNSPAPLLDIAGGTFAVSGTFVPEPSSLMLIGLGGIGLAVYRRVRRRAA